MGKLKVRLLRSPEKGEPAYLCKKCRERVFESQLTDHATYHNYNSIQIDMTMNKDSD